VLEDMAELTTAIASMETVVKERESLVRENARLRAALESAQIADGGAAPAQTLTPQRATPSKPARPPAAASALGEDEAAGVALRLRVYELLTRLQLTAVNTADGERAARKRRCFRHRARALAAASRGPARPPTPRALTAAAPLRRCAAAPPPRRPAPAQASPRCSAAGSSAALRPARASAFRSFTPRPATRSTSR
jgi:hypothetical protein